MADIKKIEVGGSTYSLCDEYARQRIEGLATIYSISCDTSYTSAYTYYDYDTEATVAFSSMTVMNSKFKSLNKDITISSTDVTAGTSAYIVLLITKGTNQYYVKKLTNLTLGDTIYVKEDATVCADRWLSAWTESPLSGTFTALDAKIDLTAYAKKTDVPQGTFTTSAPSPANTGNGGAQTALGTATVTYSKAATVTGSAGGATITSSASHGEASANTGQAGAFTISGSNFTFAGTSATITVEGDAATINDHSYQPAGTISAVTVPKHSHSMTATKATISNNVTGTATGSAGAHTHSVSGTGTLSAAEVTSVAGTVTYTPAGTVDVVVDSHSYQPEGTISQISHASHTHTVTLSTSGNKTVVTSVDANTGTAGAHSHTVDSHTHGDDKTVISGITFTANGNDTFGAGTLPSLTIGNKTVVSGITSNYGFASAISNATDSAGFYQGVMTHPIVTDAASPEGAGILRWTCVAANTTTTASTISVGSASGWSAGSLPTFTQGSKASLTTSTTSVAAPGSDTTLTSSQAAAHSHSIGKSTTTINYATGVSSVSSAGGYTVTPTFTGTTATLAHNVSTKSFAGTGVRLEAAGTVTLSGTAASAGAHTHSLTNSALTYVSGVNANTGEVATVTVTPTFTGTTATISHSFTDSTDVSLSGAYTPAGTIGGSQSVASHSHSYVKPADHTHSVTVSSHTHSITLADATATGNAACAVTDHNHSLNGHTHTVTLPTIA